MENIYTKSLEKIFKAIFPKYPETNEEYKDYLNFETFVDIVRIASICEDFTSAEHLAKNLGDTLRKDIRQSIDIISTVERRMSILKNTLTYDRIIVQHLCDCIWYELTGLKIIRNSGRPRKTKKVYSARFQVV